jgi:hypothetical protein
LLTGLKDVQLLLIRPFRLDPSSLSRHLLYTLISVLSRVLPAKVTDQFALKHVFLFYGFALRAKPALFLTAGWIIPEFNSLSRLLHNQNPFLLGTNRVSSASRL